MDTIEKKKFTKTTEDENQKKQDQIRQDHDFYTIQKNKDGSFKDFQIYRIKFLEKLKSFGFFRYDMDNGGIQYVRIQNNTVKTVNDTHIVDHFLHFVENIEQYCHEWEAPDKEEGTREISKLITSEMILEKMLRSLETYFSKALLTRLLPDKEIIVKADTKDQKFLFYENGFLTVTAEKVKFEDYSKLSEYIWQDQILKRNYSKADQQRGYYEQFIWNIAGQDQERFKAMQTIIGYNLHNFTRCKLYATVLTDSRLSDDGEANGRTGKTLWGKGLGQMLNTDEKSSVYIEINGRDFDSREAVKYTSCNLNSTLVHINDCKNKFNIENLFNDITEGIKVKKLFQDPFIIHPKLILSSNQTIIIEGESAKDRVIQFEFSDYYSSRLNPAMEFGHWFFDDWNQQEWSRFDGFMISCVQMFLKHGLIKPAEINLQIRILQDHTSREFISFMADILEHGIELENAMPGEDMFRVIRGEKYEKSHLFNLFIRMNHDFNNPKFKQRTFSKWVKMYCSNKGLKLSETRANGKDYFIFNKEEL